MSSTETVLVLCVALTPKRHRAVREEQWRADLRDGPGLGISPASLLVGALCTSVTARFYEAVNRGNFLLSQLSRGKNMKLALGMIGAAAVVVGGAVAGVQAIQTKAAEYLPPSDVEVMGYEGWWNSTPVDGHTEGLPQETVTVDTRTGKAIDAYNRATQSTLVSDVSFDVVPDPAWPANSVVIIDTATGKVIEDFIVDENGSPFDENGKPYSQ